MEASHPLDPLLRPRSIALLGASDKPDSAGRAMAEMARIDGYAGDVFPVNPSYAEIEGLTCYPSLDALPKRCSADDPAVGMG